jgi:hypothetical protein
MYRTDKRTHRDHCSGVCRVAHHVGELVAGHGTNAEAAYMLVIYGRLDERQRPGNRVPSANMRIMKGLRDRYSGKAGR